MSQTRAVPRSRGSGKMLTCVMLVFALALGACTAAENDQYDADISFTNTRIYIKQRPTWDIMVVGSICQDIAGTQREQWGKCTLELIRDNIDAPSIASREIGWAFDDGEWDDLTSAMADIYRGGVGTDGAGIYTYRCLLADRPAFRDYNWTFREDQDSHCTRGKHVI